MIKERKAKQRGQADHGWLKAQHTFSFGRYLDPEYMGYRSLRVMNEDRIAPETGFPMHPHDNMEIFTYVLEGALEHQDSMGHSTVINAGDFQKMSAGSGILHSEMNPSTDSETHLYQIWIQPDTMNVDPMHAEHTPEWGDQETGWRTILSSEVNEAPFHIHQDAKIFLGQVQANADLEKSLDPERHYWVQVLTGSLSVNGKEATAGDGLVLEKESLLKISAHSTSQVILFDLS